MAEKADIGAVARITPDVVANATKLVRKGKVYDLGMEISRAMPQDDGSAFLPYTLVIYNTWNKTGASWPGYNGFSYSTEAIMGTPHVSTHMDALCHVQFAGKTYRGVNADEIWGDFGYTKYSIDTVPPIVTRGILIDVPALKGVELLEDGYEVTPGDVKGALEMEGIKVKKGDAALIRTGKIGQFYDHAAWRAGGAGIGLEGALWLYEQGIALLGSDWTAAEWVGPGKNWEQSVHVQLMMGKGVNLMESLNLDELSRDKTYEFLFVCLPLKFKGGTGSWIRPTAVA